MKTSETVKEIQTALIGAMAEMKNIERNAENPFFHSSYTTLPDVLDFVRPVLNKHKLAVIQSPEMRELHPVLVTRIIHESGEWIEGEAQTSVEKPGPQPYGSAITYLRRYSLMGFLGLGSEMDDDDANGAQKPGAPPPAKKQDPKEVSMEQTVKNLPVAIKTLLVEAGIKTIHEAYRAYKDAGGDLDAMVQLLDEKIRNNKKQKETK